VAVTIWFTRAGAQQGTVMLAVNALLMQLFMLFSFFMDGFAFAGEAMCGRDIGRNDMAKFHHDTVALFGWSGCLAIVFTIIYICGGDWFLRIMSDDAEVVITAGKYLPWAVAIPIAGVTAFMWDGVYIGATRTRYMLISMIIATVLYFAAYFALYPALHNHALWFAFLLYLIARGLGLSLLSRRLFRPNI
jgi:MATE family multidrug resistance protein